MVNQRVVSTFVILGVMALLVPRISANPASADSSSANYNFLVASGFLCAPNDPSTCPAVARAASGDTVEVSGAGTLSLASKSITAAGAYTQNSSTGEIMTTAVWTATELLSFKSYGIAAGTLIRESRKFKAFGFSPLGLGMLAGPMPAGGLALMRLRLLADVGNPQEAILQVNCAKGKVPENQQGDGIRLAIQEGGPRFDEKVSGRIIFILRKPGSACLRRSLYLLPTLAAEGSG
jgi:hypothetical protein